MTMVWVSGLVLWITNLWLQHLEVYSLEALCSSMLVNSVQLFAVHLNPFLYANAYTTSILTIPSMPFY